VTLKPRLGSLKAIENDTIQSGTNDFLLTFHNNHRPILHCFPPRVFLAPAEGVPIGIGYQRQGSEETRMMGLPVGRNVLR